MVYQAIISFILTFTSGILAVDRFFPRSIRDLPIWKVESGSKHDYEGQVDEEICPSLVRIVHVPSIQEAVFNLVNISLYLCTSLHWTFNNRITFTSATSISFFFFNKKLRELAKFIVTKFGYFSFALELNWTRIKIEILFFAEDVTRLKKKYILCNIIN